MHASLALSALGQGSHMQEHYFMSDKMAHKATLLAAAGRDVWQVNGQSISVPSPLRHRFHTAQTLAPIMLDFGLRLIRQQQQHHPSSET